MIFKLALGATFATLALISIWLDDSFILLQIVITAAFFLFILYLQGKVRFPKKAEPDNSDEPEDRL
ncbi:MAG: hypothetical protein HOL07_00490 [Rhodospirillaceae bacterium]|jgi:hypothetical protein|nr:hypothetical protein [Rhodospirillaceae bacterium]MBT4771499.1 hypothetical protein [Rhodospirillaceae bacterium]MBT5356799.1 hypothetical protein [Rhodospirillaceae bacterium]MBT5770657.1 hypothetical protein [Rhodospirillaceae bacterium]MBT6311279.1 hypothetical protein [Rhodospirillaceae bacterium]